MSYLSDPVLTVLLCALAYLAGSMLFALPVCRAWHLPDPRAQGSGNPGATNVYRTGGWPPAALTLFLDAAKGWLPVWFAHQADLTILSQAIVALCAVTVTLPDLVGIARSLQSHAPASRGGWPCALTVQSL